MPTKYFSSDEPGYETFVSRLAAILEMPSGTYSENDALLDRVAGIRQHIERSDAALEVALDALKVAVLSHPDLLPALESAHYEVLEAIHIPVP